MGALAQALPRRVPADGSGGSTLPTIGGRQDGKPFIFVETIMGAWGGSPVQDGQDAVAHLGANQSNVPVETIEAEYPLRVERYGFVPDSGGAGRHRGGMAIERVFRLLADEATLTVRSDKRRFPPFGLAGGRPGNGSLNVVNPDTGDERILPVLVTEPVALKRGDVFRHVLASGGGWGDPLTRDPALVLEDVRLGRVTPEGARRDYGVAITRDADGVTVDDAATAALRAAAAGATP
jgi:N-methylhydantoinase B